MDINAMAFSDTLQTQAPHASRAVGSNMGALNE
jgi:hypothetical protein